MGLERLVLASLVLLTCAASVKAGNAGSCISFSEDECPPPPPPPPSELAKPYFFGFMESIIEIAASNRYDVGKPEDFEGFQRVTDVVINKDWADGIGKLINEAYPELHIDVLVFSDLQPPKGGAPDPLLGLDSSDQFATRSDATCGNGRNFKTFEADECVFLGGSVTTKIKRGGEDPVDGQAPTDNPELAAKCMVFFTSATEPAFDAGNAFLTGYTRAAEEAMNGCAQEQAKEAFGISPAVAATPLLSCVLNALPASPRGMAITPSGLPAKPPRVGGTGHNAAIWHIFFLQYAPEDGPYLYLTILLPVL